MTSPRVIFTAGILAEHAAKTEETVREIDDHIRRLTAAKQQRVAALARFRAQLALAQEPAAPDRDED